MTNAEYHKEWKKNRKLLGLCINCANKISPRSTCMCEKCLDKNNKQTKKSMDRLTRTQRKHLRLKASATRRNIDCLEIEDFEKWDRTVDKKCHYCSASIREIHTSRKSTLVIDRKDNVIGYTPQNMCYCCNRCNMLKSNFFTEGEWLEIAERYIKPRLREYQGHHNR